MALVLELEWRKNLMEVLSYKRAEIADRELVMEGKDMRVQVLTLGKNDSIPWHYHSEITDSFVCLEGTLVVDTKAPTTSYVLKAGDRCEVPPMVAHYVHGENMQAAKFMILQGVGVYDNIPVGK
jgi:mannose-6-phosphate isomerase-like protein (cupin superfamily)